MIFLTSKRCFLNVLCQIMDKNTILNANYYIADCPSPNRVADKIEDDYEYDETLGRWVKRPVENNNEGVKSATQYMVKYGTGCINPGPQIVDIYSSSADPHEFDQRIHDVLMNKNIMTNIYNEIYASPKRGNGVLFIIYYIDENVVNWGGLIASHLAEYFGEDITFVDPKYRPYVRGQLVYPGNKEKAIKVEHDLKDYMILSGFLSAVKQSPGIMEESVSNMTNHMADYKFEDAIKLYELLFPQSPLPRGNYTVEQIKEIIIERMIDSKIYLMSDDDNRPVVDRYRGGYY